MSGVSLIEIVAALPIDNHQNSPRAFRSSAFRMCAGIQCLSGFIITLESGAPSRSCEATKLMHD